MKLRKVTFRLAYQNGYNPGMSEEDQRCEIDRTRTREGFFHCWTPAIVHNPDINQEVPSTLALIEDAEDSKMYELPIDLFNFNHPVEYEER